jgi:16S rRNA (guanine966-N2)-methyltransferase
VFVEKNDVMVNAIKRNLRELSMSGEYDVLPAETAKAVRTLEKRGETFDIVFADPPYDRGFVKEVLRSLGGVDILKTSGVLVIQRSRREIVDNRAFSGDFVLTDERRYGDTNLSFFKK